jgi:hypothetical protein
VNDRKEFPVRKRTKIKTSEQYKPEESLNPNRGKHLEGLPEEEIRMIQLIAEIFVNAIVNNKKIE